MVSKVPESQIPTVEASVRRLIQVPDLDWARWMVGNRPRGLGDADFQRLFEMAQIDAVDHWAMLASEDRQCSPADGIGRYDVCVEAESPGPLDRGFVHFAVFDPGRNVVEVSQEAISKVDGLMEEFSLHEILERVSVQTLVLWHEYYHVMMRAHPTAGSLFRWIFAWKRKDGVRGDYSYLREEMAAIQFSKLASKIDYNPQVLQWLLVYAEDSVKATKMMNDILEKSVLR